MGAERLRSGDYGATLYAVWGTQGGAGDCRCPAGVGRLQQHVAFVGKSFDEAEFAAFDVAEVDVEQLAALAEPADGVADLLARIVETLADRADAEIEPMPSSTIEGLAPMVPSVANSRMPA